MMMQETNSKDTSIKKLKAAAEKIDKQKQLRKKRSWYNLRPILGCANWAIFYLLLGGREAGKSYAVTNFLVDQ